MSTKRVTREQASALLVLLSFTELDTLHTQLASTVSEAWADDICKRLIESKRALQHTCNVSAPERTA